MSVRARLACKVVRVRTPSIPMLARAWGALVDSVVRSTSMSVLVKAASMGPLVWMPSMVTAVCAVLFGSVGIVRIGAPPVMYGWMITTTMAITMTARIIARGATTNDTSMAMVMKATTMSTIRMTTTTECGTSVRTSTNVVRTTVAVDRQRSASIRRVVVRARARPATRVTDTPLAMISTSVRRPMVGVTRCACVSIPRALSHVVHALQPIS